MSDIELVKKVRIYAEEAEKNGFEVLTVPLRDLFPLLGRMEAAERERDELRAIAEEQSKLAGSNAPMAQKAEAEIARRDAAAGEPVAVISEDSLAELKQSYRPVLAFRPDHKRNSPGISLYTAAQPAVVPDIVRGTTSTPFNSSIAYSPETAFIAGANWMREQCLELGAQQQKVVELHKRKSTEVISGQRYSYVLLEDLLPELDAAGVKWEVKK